MSPTAVCTHVTQPLDVVLECPPRVALNGHGRQLGRQGRDGLGRQGAHLGARVDVVLGENARRRLRAEGVEGLERFLGGGERAGRGEGGCDAAHLDELLLVEVDTEDGHLGLQSAQIWRLNIDKGPVPSCQLQRDTLSQVFFSSMSGPVQCRD